MRGDVATPLAALRRKRKRANRATVGGDYDGPERSG